MSDHLKITTTNRGFDHMAPIPSEYGGTIRAYESSAAIEPGIWVRAVAPVSLNEPNGLTVEAPMHLTAENAWRLAEQLMTLVRDHYQGDARPERRVADFVEPGPGRAVELLRELADDEECSVDHEGYCQTHWGRGQDGRPCVYTRLTRFLAEHDRTTE